MRENGDSWDLVIVELPDSTLFEDPNSWLTPNWAIPGWKSPSFGVFAISATNCARVLVCSHSSIPTDISDQLQQNAVSMVRIDELTQLHIEHLRRESRRGKFTDVVPTIGWMRVYHGVDLPEQFKIPEDISTLIDEEVQNTRIQSDILAAALRTFESTDFSAVETLLIAMQTARYLATLEIEGKPYEMTLAVRKAGVNTQHLIGVATRLTIGLQPSSLPELEEICELAQGQETCLGIDGVSGLISGVIEIPVSADSGRILRLRSAAKNLSSLLLHLPGNGSVELIAPNGLIGQHDGSKWQWWRLRNLQYGLRSKGLMADSAGLTVLFEALDYLSFHRLSSIVAIADRKFGNGTDDVSLEPMRDIMLRPALRVATLTPMKLASMIRVDGSHLLVVNKEENMMEIEGIAMNVVPKSRDPALTSQSSGTGRKAAAALSAAYPDAVVCKVSASGGDVKVYWGGYKIGNTY